MYDPGRPSNRWSESRLSELMCHMLGCLCPKPGDSGRSPHVSLRPPHPMAVTLVHTPAGTPVLTRLPCSSEPRSRKFTLCTHAHSHVHTHICVCKHAAQASASRKGLPLPAEPSALLPPRQWLPPSPIFWFSGHQLIDLGTHCAKRAALASPPQLVGDRVLPPELGLWAPF